MANTIPLFYWSSKVFEHKAHENYGDILATYIVKEVSKKEVRFYNAPGNRKKLFKKEYLMAIGSILSYAQSKAWVWGSGIISKEARFEKATFCAVRGPLSRKRILELGYSCPETYGDPALLLPDFYSPAIEKKYRYGFIPHYVDHNIVESYYKDEDEVSIINLLNDNWSFTTDRILECEYIISSSLHGVIVAQAYGIPAIWVQFSDRLSGDNIKFADYFLSVGIKPYTAVFIDSYKKIEFYKTLFSTTPGLVNKEKLTTLKGELIAAFPNIFL